MSKKRRSYAERSKTKSATDKHIAAIQAEKERLENLTPVGIKRIIATFPELRDVIDALGWMVAAMDPTSARVIDPDSPQVTTDSKSDGIVVVGKGKDQLATLRAGAATHRYRKTQPWARNKLRHVARELHTALDGQREETKAEAPRCQKKDPQTGEKCKLFGKRQAFGQERCRGCNQAFGRDDEEAEVS